MRCCRPSCGAATIVGGAVMASGEAGRALAIGWAMWVWIAILVAILLVSMVTVSPTAPDTDAGEPPP